MNCLSSYTFTSRNKAVGSWVHRSRNKDLGSTDSICYSIQNIGLILEIYLQTSYNSPATSYTS